jgi:hypothetical protein
MLRPQLAGILSFPSVFVELILVNGRIINMLHTIYTIKHTFFLELPASDGQQFMKYPG